MRLDPWKLECELPHSRTPTRAALSAAIVAATGANRNAVDVRLSTALAGRPGASGRRRSCSLAFAQVCADAMGLPLSALVSEGAEWDANVERLIAWRAAGMRRAVVG